MKKQVAKDLLSIRAVFLRPEEPFTWASGIHSPIYCDNRLTLSYPDVRSRVEHALERANLAQDLIMAGGIRGDLSHRRGHF